MHTGSVYRPVPMNVLISFSTGGGGVATEDPVTICEPVTKCISPPELTPTPFSRGTPQSPEYLIIG
jgi:hypothetical protein